MDPKHYAVQKAFEDFAVKDSVVDKVLKKIVTDEDYMITAEDRKAIIELQEAWARLKVAKRALDEI